MDDIELAKTEQLLKQQHYSAWQLIKLYWQSSQRKSAWLFAVLILVMTVTLVGFDVAFTYWFNYFYDALQAYKADAVFKLVGVFCVLAFFWIVLQVYRYYVTQLFSLRWRRWLTNQFVNCWMEKRGYYHLENFESGTDNPDQRIQEDIGGIVSSTVSLTVGFVNALTTFPAFVYILWTLSGVLTFNLGFFGTVHIYGYLVWVGLLYNLIGTLITFKLGYPLVNLNFEQQRREATFRYAAIDLRSHAEHVALYRGEHHQKMILGDLFKNVLDNWYQIILRQKLVLWFTSGFNQTAVLLPLLAALPNYFRHVFKLGGLMQSLRAFTSVQDSLSYLVNSYTSIAEWRAIARRLTSFLNHLSDIQMDAVRHDGVVTSNEPANDIVTHALTIETPDGDMLLENVNQTFRHGNSYVIKGESGLGKSTFIRTLAGIWPYASGEIIFPKDKKIMFLPQKAYMPFGTLAEAVLFPDRHQMELRNQLKAVLHDCHLDNLVPHLDEVAPWSEKLSPGELQRVAFARVLLHKPDWVFLDESTSMLDMANEKHLYKLLQEKLPNCTIVSVGHHPSVDQFHDHIVDMSVYRTAEAQV